MQRILLIFVLMWFALFVKGQSLQFQVQEYLKRNNVPHYYHKDSIGQNSKSGYFFTNKKGQTTLSLPKGAIDMSVPTGDSVVYFKITSPKFIDKAGGVLMVSEYHLGKKLNEKAFGIGEVRGATGIRVDAAVDNKDVSSLSLYFMDGQILNFPLQKAVDSLIGAFCLNKEDEKVEFGKYIHSWLLYEDDKMGEAKTKLEKWFERMNEKMLMEKIGQQVNHYYVISYKLIAL